MKDNKASLKGVVSIKVFDKEGKIKYEESSDNAIQEGVNVTIDYLMGYSESNASNGYRGIELLDSNNNILAKNYSNNSGNTEYEGNVGYGASSSYAYFTVEWTYTNEGTSNQVVHKLNLVSAKYNNGWNKIIFSSYTLSSDVTLTQYDKMKVTWTIKYVPS